MTWYPVPDFRREYRGRPRGEVADFFPVLPAPFTLSIVREGWEAAARALASSLDTDVTTGWRVDGGQVWADEDFWRRVGLALDVPPATLGRVLGFPEWGKDVRPAKKQRRFGFLRRRAHKGLDEKTLTRVEEVAQRVARWERQVRRLSWTQADILQVMEEIAERMGAVLWGYTMATLALAQRWGGEEGGT